MLRVMPPAIEVWFFDQAFTATVDNTPWSPSDADLQHVVAIASTADIGGGWYLAANNSIAKMEFVQRVEPGVTSLFAQMVIRAGATYGVGDLRVRPNYLQD